MKLSLRRPLPFFSSLLSICELLVVCDRGGEFLDLKVQCNFFLHCSFKSSHGGTSDPWCILHKAVSFVICNFICLKKLSVCSTRWQSLNDIPHRYLNCVLQAVSLWLLWLAVGGLFAPLCFDIYFLLLFQALIAILLIFFLFSQSTVPWKGNGSVRR